jgi:putative membrane protein
VKTLTLLRTELKRLTATPLARLAFVALMTVPLLYGGMYLWANQNPYAKLDHIPAAIVNADAGAEDADGHAVDYGDTVEKQLVDGKDFDWHVVSASQAASGLADETYNFVFTIPSSFSANLTSASSSDPTPARIHLTTNDTTGYLSSTIADQAGTTIRAAVTAQVGKEAAKTLLVGLDDIRSQLSTAADGSQQLVDGAKKLKSGLDTANSGATQLSSGAATLSTGASSLNSGLQTLESKTAALPSQTAALASGAAQVADGDSRLASGASTLADGATALASGAGDLNTTVQAAATKSAAAVAALPAQQQAIARQLLAAGFTPEQVQQVATATAPLATALTDGDSQLQRLAGATSTLSSTSGQLASGATTLSTSAAQLKSGSADVSSGAATLSASAPALTAGIAQAAAGSSSLATGAASAASGAATLSGGIDSLDQGAASLVSGTTKLTSGLDDGVKQIPATTAQTRDEQAAAIADPVSITDSSIASAGNYGAGLAPFFISLAAWIGMYALFLIIKPISKRALTAIKAPARITLGGWLAPAVLGVVQMVALFLIVKFALGFDVHDWPGMIAIMVLASVTFAAIIGLLNVILGSVGQFLGLVLMLIQLVTAGGTFPWQTLPGPLAALHFALPMSYAVDGIRQLMYGGNMAAAWQDAGVPGLWLLGALMLTFLAARRMTKRRTMRDLRPSLIG